MRSMSHERNSPLIVASSLISSPSLTMVGDILATNLGASVALKYSHQDRNEWTGETEGTSAIYLHLIQNNPTHNSSVN